MKDISQIDKNFQVETKLDLPDVKFYNVLAEPFKIYGVFYEGGKFRRLPEAVAKTVSEGVFGLHTHTAGGRVRFKTDSPYVAIHTKMPSIGKMPHFALTGSAGFDLYVGSNYKKTFVPPFDIENGYENVARLGTSEMREITINFPLYSSVGELYIGISDTATLLPPAPYEIETPIVYYGSSITQGGCASRAGTAYQGHISRRLKADFINLGFSGNAKGEDEMAEYISGLTMSAFVLDYDYNAPTVEHLKNTHERFFRRVREKNPELPIIMMSRPHFDYDENELQRLEVVKTTYENALRDGDKNVYFIDGRDLMKAVGSEGTVDDCHPTDLGFASMAKAIGDVLEKIL